MKMAMLCLYYRRGVEAGMVSQSSQSWRKLSDYIGPDSIGFFTILGLDTDFLEESVKDWAASPTYQAAKAAVKNLPVVNDAAERGVKITSDFLDSARNEERFQTVLQVVENDRRKMPNQQKRHIRVK